MARKQQSFRKESSDRTIYEIKRGENITPFLLLLITIN